MTVVPLYVVKLPPIRIFPSGWRVITLTVPPAPVPVVNVVSNVPSVLRRAMRLAVVPLYTVNSPPIRILPSGWRAIAFTVSSVPLGTPVKKLGSISPACSAEVVCVKNALQKNSNASVKKRCERDCIILLLWF